MKIFGSKPGIITKGFYLAIMLIGGAVILYGLIVFCYQVFSYFYTGVWTKLPSILLFIELPDDLNYFNPKDLIPKLFVGTQLSEYIQNPKSWLGVHKIVVSVLKFVHYSILPIILGCFIISEGKIEFDKLERE